MPPKTDKIEQSSKKRKTDSDAKKRPFTTCEDCGTRIGIGEAGEKEFYYNGALIERSFGGVCIGCQNTRSKLCRSCGDHPCPESILENDKMGHAEGYPYYVCTFHAFNGEPRAFQLPAISPLWIITGLCGGCGATPQESGMKLPMCTPCAVSYLPRQSEIDRYMKIRSAYPAPNSGIEAETATAAAPTASTSGVTASTSTNTTAAKHS